MGFNHEPRGGRNGYKAVLKPEEVHVNMIEYGSSHLGIQHYSTIKSQEPQRLRFYVNNQYMLRMGIYQVVGYWRPGKFLWTRDSALTLPHDPACSKKGLHIENMYIISKPWTSQKRHLYRQHIKWWKSWVISFQPFQDPVTSRLNIKSTSTRLAHSWPTTTIRHGLHPAWHQSPFFPLWDDHEPQK